MTAQPIDTEASGTTPGASALNGFISVSNTVIVMLDILAADVHTTGPGTSELITSFGESVAGQALDLITRWPA